MGGAALLILIGLSILSLYIFYRIIKAAVKNGIIEARRIINTPPSGGEQDGNRIAQINCPACKQNYDMDYPKCPNCKTGNPH
ncbi:MAG: hypothetical protein FWB71_01115 [Defluviitaleaceae bacterium]|nr:hypothetical protein [Defluviitaleaceae bacterium]